MSKNPAATPPTPSLSPQSPPPAPVSGIQRQYSQIAPQLTESPKGSDPVKELNARQAAAIAKATGKAQDSDAAEAREGAPPPPKAKTSTPSSAPDSTKPSEKSSDKPSSESSKKAAESSTDSDDDDAEAPSDAAPAGTPREPRYTVASLRKWVEKNPEEAAELREKVFGMPKDTREEWIRIKNKSRKVRGDIAAERDAALVTLRAEREAAETARNAVDEAAGKLGPVIDLWDAVGQKIRENPERPQIDFEAADAAFQQNTGVSIDDYMRARARRGVASSPEAVNLRAQVAKLERQLKGKPSEQIAEAAKAKETPKETEAKEETKVAPKTKPKREAKDWGDELPERHKLRQIADWNTKLDAEMRRFHDSDLDEYDADPEEVANKLLKLELQLLSEPDEDDDEKPKKPKLKTKSSRDDGIPDASKLRPKKSTTKVEADDDDEDSVKVGKMTWPQRQKWAIDRAMARGASGSE